MNRLSSALDDASSLPALLAAAQDAFEAIMAAAWRQADTPAGFSTAMVYAATAAAEGRDAILAAPSLPARPPAVRSASLDHGNLTASSILDVAAAITAVCDGLVRRLTAAARDALSPGDRAACRAALLHARDIRQLLAGHRHD
jgi:hypothetical protein